MPNSVDPDLGAFVADEVACPSTMVDRIVPATTDEDRERIATALGVADAWPVVTEPFTQWVIEDHFPTGRPAWEEAGAEFVADVEPYEHMKLRLLNGSHSTLAYLGYLSGYETVADTMADPAFEQLSTDLMDEEVTPTLHMPPGADLASYKRALDRALQEPCPEAPHLADRHGRLAEAAAAPAGHGPRPPGRGTPRSIASPSASRPGCAM